MVWSLGFPPRAVAGGQKKVQRMRAVLPDVCLVGGQECGCENGGWAGPPLAHLLVPRLGNCSVLTETYRVVGRDVQYKSKHVRYLAW